MREGMAKARYNRYTRTYLPAFRTFHKEEGHVNVPRSHPVLGQLVNCIRTGNTTVLPHYEDELVAMGLDLSNQKLVQRERRLEEEYMPALRTFHKEEGHVNVPYSHPKLGNLLRVLFILINILFILLFISIIDDSFGGRTSKFLYEQFCGSQSHWICDGKARLNHQDNNNRYNNWDYNPLFITFKQNEHQ